MSIKIKKLIAPVVIVFVCLYSNIQVLADSKDLTATWTASGATASVNSNVGSASTSFAIEVPQGRGGVGPSLVLGYSPGAKNTFFGSGWSLELGAIQVSTKNGAPKYSSEDTFIFHESGGSQELVYNTQTGKFHSKIEGQFLKMEHLTTPSDHWKVTDKNGTKYFFGQTASSKLYDPGNASRIFQWLLDYVEDAHGNFMEISYFKDTVNNQTYPDEIKYTGYQGASALLPYASVKFERETRNDKAFSFIQGFPVTTHYRINKVLVKVDGILRREYDINYIYSDSTKQSLIQSISLLDRNGFSLPPTTFAYYNERGFELASGWSIPSDVAFARKNANNLNEDLGVRIADVNSDGYDDVMKYYYDRISGSITRKTYINTKQNSWVHDPNWTLPADIDYFVVNGIVTQNNPLNQKQQGVRLSDLNGDAKIDVIQGYNLLRSHFITS
jgi:hypothetical protein